MYFFVILCIVCFVSFSVLFVCICVLYYCHRLATQLQLNISYHIVYYYFSNHTVFVAGQCTSLASLPHTKLIISLFKWLAVLLSTEEIPGLNLSLETSSPAEVFLGFP